MFLVGIGIGLYTFTLFVVGILKLLEGKNIFIVSILFLLTACFITYKRMSLKGLEVWLNSVSQSRLAVICLLFIILQTLVNLIGTLGPELAFDALWYHLTIPKIYLQQHAVTFLPGNLFYYSTMPKLTEMLFLPALSLGNEIAAKGIHFLFGLLTCVVLYQLARKYFSVTIGLLAVVIFYSNLVVGWESITAYIDLARTFYEALALFAYLLWYEKKERTYLLLCALMVGLAISTKLLALGSLGIFLVLLVSNGLHEKKSVQLVVKEIALFAGVSLGVALPWFIFSFLSTGNPVYPFFTPLYSTGISWSILSPWRIISDFWTLFTQADDPITPIYIIFLPLLYFVYKDFPNGLKVVCQYALLALIVWYITPRTGGGRFILPYLPALSLIAAASITGIQKSKSYSFLGYYLIGLVIVVSILDIGFRAAANAKYLPVILGLETKAGFLTKHLNFSFGDFYDTDGYFSRTVKPNDRVLLYGFHNLYYVDFPFIHASMVTKGDRFTAIAVQDGKLPERFSGWQEIYYNPITHVRFYTKQGNVWVY